MHNDHTVNSAPRRVRDHLGADAEELLKHRFGVVNVWRPIRGPVLDSPLALCDARSFSDDDLIASDLVYKHVRGETSRVEYKPDHRWYYFSEQQRDEALLIRVHDSENDGRARLSFHTSFENPLAQGAPPRESIEVRTLVFFLRNAGCRRPERRAAAVRQDIVLNNSPTNGRENETIRPNGQIAADRRAVNDPLLLQVRSVDRAKVTGRAIVPHRDRIRCPAETHLIIRMTAQFLVQVVEQRGAFAWLQSIDRLDEPGAEEQRLAAGFRMDADQRMQRRESALAGLPSKRGGPAGSPLAASSRTWIACSPPGNLSSWKRLVIPAPPGRSTAVSPPIGRNFERRAGW